MHGNVIWCSKEMEIKYFLGWAKVLSTKQGWIFQSFSIRACHLY